MNLYFDEDSQKLIVNAKNEMFQLKHPYVGSEHLLLAILHMKSLEITNVLNKYGITYDSFRNKLIDSVGVGSKANNWFLFTPLLKKILINVSYYVKDSDKMVTPYHLLLAILKEGDGIANRILITMNVDLIALYDKFLITKLSSNRNKILLDSLAINMNERSKNNYYDSVIGRDKEIEQLIRTLLRKKKNNPLLLGEAGVGKTAIVEELAHLITIGKVPINLKNVTIYSLSMATLISGTKYRGEFEERFQKLIDEVKNDPNIVIFIDEIHTLIGAGGAEGAIDASNILKPALARGELKIIGATTTAEYFKYFSDDKAFDRRFQKIYIEEPTRGQVEDILNSLVFAYEKFHNVKISKNILDKIICYSSRYILKGKQPDKAIDLLDEVCTYSVTRKDRTENMLEKYITKIQDLKNEKNNFIVNCNFAMAKRLKKKEDKLYSKYNNLLLSSDSVVVTELDIENVIYYKTGILLGDRWIKKIKAVFFELKKIIFGQKKILNQLFNIFSSNNYFYKEKPFSLLFVGKNGVGKTFLSQELANLLVGKNNCHLFHMDEYRDGQTFQKIIDSKKISFLNLIREKPFSIFIFDSIDQAHPAILSFLLKILDDGLVSTVDGEVYNLSKCIFIFTTNISLDCIGFSSKNTFSSLLKTISDKVYDVCYFDSITKSSVKQYISNYCKINNLGNDVYDYLISDVLNKYDYQTLGFSKLSWYIEKSLKSSLLKI